MQDIYRDASIYFFYISCDDDILLIILRSKSAGDLEISMYIVYRS